MSEEFTGKTALVTGGSRGIGFGVAAELLARGAKVAITARNEDGLREAAAELAAGDRLLTISADVGDSAAAPEVAKHVIGRFGSLDLLFNNAGVYPAPAPLMDLSNEVIEKTFQVNVVGALAMIKAAWHGWMKEHGGAIVNNASIAPLRVTPMISPYSASKAAMFNLTQQLSNELAPGVRINAVAPSLIKTRMAEVLYAGNEELVTASHPLRRLGVPDDVASAVAFLLSDSASWITGEMIAIDGGFLKNGAGAAGSSEYLS